MTQNNVSLGLPVYYEFVIDDNMVKEITYCTCTCEIVVEKYIIPNRPVLMRNANVVHSDNSSEFNKQDDMLSFLKYLSKKE